MDVERLSKLMTSPPVFGANRLLLWVTGSINAAMVPYWLNWLRQMYPDLETNILVSRSAQKFLSMNALSHLVTGKAWRDDWDEPGLPTSSHIAIESDADCIGVFPATLNAAMQLASGTASSPALMTLQSTEKPVVLAPSYPAMNRVIEAQLALLLSRPNVRQCEYVPAFSVGKQGWSGRTGFFMPLLIESLETLRRDLHPGDESSTSQHEDV